MDENGTFADGTLLAIGATVELLESDGTAEETFGFGWQSVTQYFPHPFPLPTFAPTAANTPVVPSSTGCATDTASRTLREAVIIQRGFLKSVFAGNSSKLVHSAGIVQFSDGCKVTAANGTNLRF